MSEVMIKSSILVFIWFQIFFVWSVIKDDISVIDLGWGPSMAIYIVSFALWQKELSLIHYLAITVVTIWALRLSIFLFIRNKSVGEDKRYQEIASHWKGPKHLNSYFRIFTVQAIISITLSIPISFIFTKDMKSAAIIFIALAFLCFIYEAVADQQKFNFKQKNKNKFCNVGLWSRSRYPNYFGELSFWWSLSIIGLMQGQYWSLATPILLSIIIIKFTGISILEENYKQREGYEKYKNSTNLLFPKLF